MVDVRKTDPCWRGVTRTRGLESQQIDRHWKTVLRWVHARLCRLISVGRSLRVVLSWGRDEREVSSQSSQVLQYDTKHHANKQLSQEGWNGQASWPGDCCLSAHG